MSLASVKPYFRTRLEALGYVEHEDGFNVENIPKPRLRAAFHVDAREARGASSNHDNLEIEVPVVVRVFKAPARNVKGVVDAALTAADSVIADLCSATNRLTQSGLKNVLFEALALEPLAESNDNGVVVRMEFLALVIVSIR